MMIPPRRNNPRKIFSHLRPFYGRPDLTPLVDVFFILLLFFLFSNSFIKISGVEVELPRAATGAIATDLDRHVVTMTWRDGVSMVYFNDRPMDADELKSELAKLALRDRRVQVLFYCDRHVPYGEAVQVRHLILNAGLALADVFMPPEGTTQVIFE